MQRNPLGLIISISIVLVICGLYFFPYKPHFVIPRSGQTQLYKAITILSLIAIIFLPINIQFPQASKSESLYQTPVQILFDVSLSMAANDIVPSRFAVAKAMVDDILAGWNNYPTSTILFSGIPFVHMAFGTHTDSARAKRATTHLGQFPPVPQFVGTAIGDALLLGIQNMENNGFGSGIMILITDGDSNIGYEPDEVLGILQKKTIPLYTIGIGQGDDFTVGYDYFGGEILTTYNPEFLEKLSAATSGQSWIIQSNDDITTVTQQIIQTIQSRAVATEIYPIFSLNSILLFIVIGRMIIVTIRRCLARYKNK